MDVKSSSAQQTQYIKKGCLPKENILFQLQLHSLKI